MILVDFQNENAASRAAPASSGDITPRSEPCTTLMVIADSFEIVSALTPAEDWFISSLACPIAMSMFSSVPAVVVKSKS